MNATINEIDLPCLLATANIPPGWKSRSVYLAKRFTPYISDLHLALDEFKFYPNLIPLNLNAQHFIDQSNHF